MNNSFFAGSETFVAVVRHGSITAAAKALRLSKAAVSQRLSLFEESLGLALLQRTTRAHRLTMAGERVFDACVDAIDAVDEARTRLMLDARDVGGRLAIAGPSTFLSRVLVPVIAAFQQRYPKVDVALRGADWALDFAAEDIDIGFRIGPVKSRQLVYDELFTSTRVLCATRKFVERCPHRLRTPKDLERAQCVIHVPSGRVWHLQNSRSSQEESVTPTQTTTVDTIELALSLVDQDGGIALLPEFLVRQQLEAGPLTRVLAGWVSPAQPVHLVCSRARAFAPQVVAFRSFLATDPWTFDPQTYAE